MAARMIGALLGMLTVAVATAQPLSDPTRPPSAAPEEASDAGEKPASRLQSVLLSPARKLAVIDGRTVRIGDTIGDARVVAISPSQVTLQRGRERQTLTLHPGIEKKR